MVVDGRFLEELRVLRWWIVHCLRAESATVDVWEGSLEAQGRRVTPLHVEVVVCIVVVVPRRAQWTWTVALLHHGLVED